MNEQDLQRHSEWLEAHPWWAAAIGLWFTLCILVLAELLRLGMDELAHWLVYG